MQDPVSLSYLVLIKILKEELLFALYQNNGIAEHWVQVYSYHFNYQERFFVEHCCSVIRAIIVIRTPVTTYKRCLTTGLLTAEISTILAFTTLIILCKSALIAYDLTGKMIENIKDGWLIKAGGSFYVATKKI